jgi:hypothetical protein
MLRSFRNWKVVAGLIASTNLIGSGAVLAQGWGEQRPLQFGIVGAGGSAMTAEIYRRQFLLGSQQLGVAQVNNFNGGGGGGGGGGISGVTGSAQASSQLNNSNQVTFSGPVTVGAGGNLYLNTGPQGASNQTSTGTSQGSTNSQSTGGVQSLAGNQTASATGNGQVTQGGTVASAKKPSNFLNTSP